ncbi:unnamed protein product [Zymoseptoria tritici ST99CH_3D7]|uniref:glucan endo-1,3-beta-D-glucosidase n=1 Tax=Zymoseptoria tritici (strain ST99CH_3D7) TaxID=1276538 RepID=A0A1X7RUK4_ZYMT9|nr:unnamed protein product [Zymoseptoria tritici ST99CH_3D7]
MKSFITAAALLAATVSADLCQEGVEDTNGNFFCQKVNAITYTGVGHDGSYNKITSMDPTTGACSSAPYGYSGSLSPLDEEVSIHLRGPMLLKQFAVYMPHNSSTSPPPASKARRHVHDNRHGHAHAHMHKERNAKEEKRALGDIVSALIDGKWQTWANNYNGGAAAAAAPAVETGAPAAAPAPAPAPAPAAAPAAAAVEPVANRVGSGSSSSDSGEKSDPADATGNWARQAYYNSEAGIAAGLVFLNHQGGDGSGTWDMTYGNSLSYASKDGTAGAPSPQILADTTLASSTEIVIMTDQPCTDGSCGYTRPDTVAHHGFDGPSKAFFFEFGMPDDGQGGASEYDAVNMPAIWMLNAQIPLTLQYGDPKCSCWTTGCGEFDVFEVLAAGDTRCKSTLHGNVAGGDSDYFERPTNGTIKAALLLFDDNIHIKILDDSTEFGPNMGTTFLKEMAADTMEDSVEKLVSLFKLGG